MDIAIVFDWLAQDSVLAAELALVREAIGRVGRSPCIGWHPCRRAVHHRRPRGTSRGRISLWPQASSYFPSHQKADNHLEHGVVPAQIDVPAGSVRV
jgi:hypothetical protein